MNDKMMITLTINDSREAHIPQIPTEPFSSDAAPKYTAVVIEVDDAALASGAVVHLLGTDMHQTKHIRARQLVQGGGGGRVPDARFSPARGGSGRRKYPCLGQKRLECSSGLAAQKGGTAG
jgi:hypothetical protein